jgi:hypothetical protein
MINLDNLNLPKQYFQSNSGNTLYWYKHLEQMIHKTAQTMSAQLENVHHTPLFQVVHRCHP